MPSFKYTAKTQDGKTIAGFVEGQNTKEAIAKLREQNLVLLSIVEAAQKTSSHGGGKKAKLDDIAIFCRQLATMVESGIPVANALNILAAQIENKSLKETISKIYADIVGGASLSAALAKYPAVFSSLFINMVKAGESSGTLDVVLNRLAIYLEKTSSLQRKIKSSLVYPAIVSLMALSITLLLILKVIPAFKNIFALLGGDLPTPTKVLILISDTLRHWFLVVAIVFGALVMAAARYVRTPFGRMQFDRFKLKAPVFGKLFQQVAIARFSRTLATLTRSGVPILASLDIVSKTSGNAVIERAVDKTRQNIKEGESIAGPLEKSGVFAPMVVRMIGVGEQTGRLDQMLDKIADFYEERVDAAVAGLTSVIEPLVIAFLGIVVGGIVIAMFLPIFKLTQLIAH
jgi:type IV pilus assembly protein PilC